MAQAEQSKGLFANKNKGKRFTFEGRNLSTDQIVRGEVVAKDEEEARKKLQRRGIRPLRVSKVKSTHHTGRYYCLYPPACDYDESRVAVDAGF